jgi:hypothetical protein
MVETTSVVIPSVQNTFELDIMTAVAGSPEICTKAVSTRASFIEAMKYGYV